MVKTILVPVSWAYLSREEMDREASVSEGNLNQALNDGFKVITSHNISAAGRQLVVIILHKPDEE